MVLARHSGCGSIASKRRALALILLVAPTIAVAGCKKRPMDELAAQLAEPASSAAVLPPLTLTDDTPDLLLTWVDAKGDVHQQTKPADVPMEGRDQVRVEITSRDEESRDLLYVANLTVKNVDGTYPVSTTRRADWEAMIAKRREALLRARVPAETEDPSSSSQPPPPASAEPGPAAVTVVVYGASWCEACHQAMQYLKRRKVPVIEKDIEKDPAAEAEMRAKLARAGIRTGSIPIIDVKGKILVGFEPHAVDAAIAGASSIAL